MKDIKVEKAYEAARERYAAIGTDTDKALDTLQKISLSLHCWQADDLAGFEVLKGNALSGGIQVTGNYPGRARNIDELRADILKAVSLIPGRHRLSLHEIYGDFQGKPVDRNEVTPIEHTKRCRIISEEIGKYQKDPCIMNIWVHDGSKEVPASRLKYRQILKDSLDEIFAQNYENMKAMPAICAPSSMGMTQAQMKEMSIAFSLPKRVVLHGESWITNFRIFSIETHRHDKGYCRGRVSAETMLLSGGTVSVFEDMTATANASTKATSVPVGEMPGNCQEGNVSDT